MQSEVVWARAVALKLQQSLAAVNQRLEVNAGRKLPYAYEVLYYHQNGDAETRSRAYETDLLVAEVADGTWKPRVVIETKLARVTTHDAITYSQKAATHKQVHPYLRYGILLGHRRHYPLPGRLFRHGAHFDFMASWVAEEPSQIELEQLGQLLIEEVHASRLLDELMYTSRNPGRRQFWILHKRLTVVETPQN